MLDPKKNSLNLIRLVLAGAVLVSHSFALAGEPEPSWADHSLGSWAVLGFFVVSGYLITGARLRSDGGRYFINRVVRIFPGFLVCLVVVAFVFAPVAYYAEQGTLGGFLTTPNTPLDFVFANALLHMADYSVAGTLGGVPLAGSWNGSLWSLYYEFLCYIIIGVAAVIPAVRARPWPIVAMFALSVVIHANIDVVGSYLGQNGDFVLLMYLLPYFLGGAVLFVLKDKVPLRGLHAAVALAVSIGIVALVPHWGGQLSAPLLAYALIWLAAAMPSPEVFSRHDFSYGVYIYAWPVTQLLVLVGVHRLGMLVLDAAVAILTAAAAAASWFLVERPAKALAGAAGRRSSPGATPEERPDGSVRPAVGERAVPAPQSTDHLVAPGPLAAGGTESLDGARSALGMPAQRHAPRPRVPSGLL